ncbi:MAG TPA: long-chain-acyl-CoA synthetase [Xanthobacteraceae bacterium]|nr:long-chain-acyl-CoA synthetase [Xanthobacteraceae bacterium]
MHVSAQMSAPGTDRAADTPAKAWLRALEMTAPIAANPTHTLPAMMDALADEHGDAPALLNDRETMSYRALAARANRYARWALARGVEKGDTVGLMMPSCPDYMAAWLGITRVGGVVALINTNLTGRALAHCVDIVAPRHVIVGGDLSEAWASAQPLVASRARVWMHGTQVGEGRPIDWALARYSDAPLEAAEQREVTIDDAALYIYTSGTTGLPKAAKVTHSRVLTWSCWFAGMMDTKPDDRMYDCLPMYHSVGGVVATGAMLVNGGSVAIREKFSASQFWDDVARFDCTLVQYIGELARYLVNAPPHPRENTHRVRLACGNGLRADVWEKFQERFAIPRIVEFYAATEGNLSLYNVEGKAGAIGRVPSFLAHRFPAAIVRFDTERGEPVRDADGFCIRCAPDEVGEAIGKIDPKTPGGRFDGYTDAEASEKKVLRNAFKPDDAWFRTGDLMRKDAQGYFYFVDRIGDTFRWKGENVSTEEVAAAVAGCPGVLDATVYGVPVPGADGKAGMAALVVGDCFDLSVLRRQLECLPAYARPVFVRIRQELETTATFKHQKGELAQEGYDPAATADAIYCNDPSVGTFVRMDSAMFARVRAGQIRL